MREQRGQLLGLTFAVTTLLTLGVLFHWPGGLLRARADNGLSIPVTTLCNSGSAFDAASAAAQLATTPSTTIACHAQWPANVAYTTTSESISWGDSSKPSASTTLQGATHSFTYYGAYSVVDRVTFCATKNANSCFALVGTAATVNVSGGQPVPGCNGSPVRDAHIGQFTCVSVPGSASSSSATPCSLGSSPATMTLSCAGTSAAPLVATGTPAPPNALLCDDGSWATPPQACPGTTASTPGPAMPAPQPPATPAGLTASETANGALFGWAASAGATGYMLTIDVDGETSTVSLDGGQSSYTLAGAQPAQQACFTVAAGNAAGWSAWSAWSCATP